MFASKYHDRYDLTIQHSRVKHINGVTGKATIYSYCVWPEPRLNGSRFYADKIASARIASMTQQKPY